MADTEEFRRVKRRPTKSAAPGSAEPAFVETEEKRTLGLTIVRGAHVVSSTVEGPPPTDPAARLGKEAPGPGGPPAAMSVGPGISRPAGRGLPTGLTGPAAGVGGPGPGGFGGFPGAPGGFPGAPPQGFPGRGAPPGKHTFTSYTYLTKWLPLWNVCVLMVCFLTSYRIRRTPRIPWRTRRSSS